MLVAARQIDRLPFAVRGDGLSYRLVPLLAPAPAPGSYCLFSSGAMGWWFSAMCPCGCEEVMSLRVLPGGVVPEPGESPVWWLDGYSDTLTLLPLIADRTSCGWRGWLQAGVWVSA